MQTFKEEELYVARADSEYVSECKAHTVGKMNYTDV